MSRSHDRDDGHEAGEDLRALRGQASADPTQPYKGNRQVFRNGQEHLRELAAGVAVTQEGLAATLHDMADRARREECLDDARRLESEAEAALLGAAHGVPARRA